MRAGLLPKLLLSPSVLLMLVCVYGYIAFTFYLSLRPSVILPFLEWRGTEIYTRLMAQSNWQISVGNLWVFSGLYILIASGLGMLLAVLIDQQIRAE